MASIFNRKGRFYISFYAANRSPKQKQLSLGTEDEREAQRLKLDLEDAFDAGDFDPWHRTVEEFLNGEPATPDDLTCSKALDRFLAAKKREDCTEKTLRTYRGIIDRMLRRSGLREADIASLSRSPIEKYVRQPDVSAATQQKRYTHVRAWINWLRKEEYLSGNPLDKISAPKGGRKLPKALTRDEFKTLTNAANPWFERLLKFAVYSGMRPGELGRLRWSDVDFDRDLIRIDRQKNRTESTIALTGAGREVLEEMLIEAAQADVYETEREGMEDTAASDDLIFNRDGRQGDRWSEYISKRFLALRRECGIRDEVTMYSCRHAHATWLADQGVPLHHIKEQMRHADISTTQKYLHVSNRRLKESLSGVF